MALSLRDMVVGTIVDHSYCEREADRRMVQLSTRRRGIITKIEGDGGPQSNEGSVKAIWVQFKPAAEPERLEAKFLDRFLPADHPEARKAMRRLTGENKVLGAILPQKPEPVKVVTEDALMLTPKPSKKIVHDRRAGVEEEAEEEEEEGEVKPRAKPEEAAISEKQEEAPAKA